MPSMKQRRARNAQRSQQQRVVERAKEFEPGQFRMLSTGGHYLVLIAEDKESALKRWPEFYPKVPVESVTTELI